MCFCGLVLAGVSSRLISVQCQGGRLVGMEFCWRTIGYLKLIRYILCKVISVDQKFGQIRHFYARALTLTRMRGAADQKVGFDEKEPAAVCAEPFCDSLSVCVPCDQSAIPPDCITG